MMAFEPRSQAPVLSAGSRPLARAGLLAGAVGVVLITLGFMWSAWAVKREIETIAVLPFENLSQDPSQEFFADGMTGELTATLAKTGAVRVISWSSATAFKPGSQPLPRIAGTLGADALVRGSVLRAGGRVRIDVQITHGTSDRPVWAQSFEQDGSDVLALEAAVAKAVVAQVSTRLPLRSSAAASGSVDEGAFEAYLRGRTLTRHRGVDSIDRGIALLQQASAIDPTWAVPHAALADVYRERDASGISGAAALMKTEAERALQLDDSLAEAHLALARWSFAHDWSWAAADRAFARALQLNPSLGAAHVGRASLYETLGRADEAVASARRGARLEPISPPILAEVGRILYRARRYQESGEVFQQALRFDPQYVPALEGLYATEAVKGNVEQLRLLGPRLDRQATKLPPLALDVKRALFAWRTADFKGVRRMAGELDRRVPDRTRERAFVLAMVYSLGGNRNRAMSWLERGVADRTLSPPELRDPLLDGVRRDPRFVALLRRLGMAQ